MQLASAVIHLHCAQRDTPALVILAATHRRPNPFFIQRRVWKSTPSDGEVRHGPPRGCLQGSLSRNKKGRQGSPLTPKAHFSQNRQKPITNDKTHQSCVSTNATFDILRLCAFQSLPTSSNTMVVVGESCTEAERGGPYRFRCKSTEVFCEIAKGGPWRAFSSGGVEGGKYWIHPLSSEDKQAYKLFWF